ncbi:MAG: hypothetical protein JWN40_5714 [Phycisphaerales bacterium]|nr:hypothetical protein [Phycisphaerales bacterium]
MNAGDVFRFEGIADIHVWTIISDPRRDPQKLLMVNFTTWEPHLDQACVIEVGEHPFIRGRTVVNYARSRVVSDAQLELLRAKGRIQMLEPLTPALLTKMRTSALESTTLPLENADILLDQELVD